MPDQRTLVLDNPWEVRATDFPAQGSAREKLQFMVNYAVLAPSILNAQPWRFRIAGSVLSVHADPARDLPVTDPDRREVTISCGAALLNLRVALRGFGCDSTAKILPARDDPGRLAQILLTGTMTPPSEDERRLRDAIPARRTNRLGFEDRPLGAAALADMAAAARREGAALTVLDSADAKRRAAELVGEAERMLLANPSFRQELSDWIYRRLGETAAPVSGEAQRRLAGHVPDMPSRPDLSTPIAANIARMFASGDAAAIERRERAEASPVLVLITTKADSREDWVIAGQAMQRVLLVATLAGISAAYLSPPIEVSSLRPRLSEIFGTGDFPQVLLQFGYGAQNSPMARRPVSAVLSETPP